MSAKDRVLSRILREKRCGRSRLTLYSGVASKELTEIVRQLEADGKIKSWPKGTRKCYYTPPDAPDPWPVAQGRKKPAKTPNPSPARKVSPEGNHVQSMIGALMEKREELTAKLGKVNRAIEALQEI